jgi:hypothetical protein
VAHVDDLLVQGDECELQNFKALLADKYEIKSQMLGPGLPPGKFLGRTIEWHDWGLSWQGDTKLVKELLKDWELSESRSVYTPGVKDPENNIDPWVDGIPMEGEMAARYRSAAAKLNYVSLDNPCIAFASKEVSRTMAKPLIGDEVQLKRVLRYLSKIPTCRYNYRWQSEPENLEGYTDSDWAGCRKTRRSTSGGVILHGGHLIHHWARTQASVALSSCEAELNAGVKITSELIGLVQILGDLGISVGAKVYGDCAPMKGVIERRGVGKVKHLSLRQLWMQEKIREGAIIFVKVPRDDNPADALTHHWARQEGNSHFQNLNVEERNYLDLPDLGIEGGCVNS